MDARMARFVILVGATAAFFVVFGRILRVLPGLGVPIGPVPIGPVGKRRRRRRRT